MSAIDSVTVTTRVAVDPDTAFEVFTGEIDAWWGRAAGPGARPRPRRRGAIALEPGVGGRLLEIDDGGDVLAEFARVRVWEPGKRLVLEWCANGEPPDRPTEVEVRFEAIAGGTRVTLMHRGWQRLGEGALGARGLSDESFPRMIGNCWLERLDEVKNQAEAAQRRDPRSLD